MTKELFEQKFVDKMFKYMWSYVNKDMIKSMFKNKINNYGLTFKTKKDINDDNWIEGYRNTITFKGNINTGGHWVFVDDQLNAHSTYEKMLLYDDDDGTCHGAAMIYAFRYNVSKFPLVDFPSSKRDYLTNYRSLISFYKWLITSGKWDKALKIYFPNEVEWINDTTSKESQKALKYLNQFLDSL